MNTLINLPILKFPEYISPSSFAQWEQCNFKFYLMRMANSDYIPNVVSLAAAIGSAFDAYLKCAIAAEIAVPIGTLSEYLAKNIPMELRDQATAAGERLFKVYTNQGCLKRLLDEGVIFVELDKTEAITHGGISIPVRSLPDLVTRSGRILECKVSGAASNSGASPCPGYKSNYVNGVNKGAHGRFGEPLEALHADWAQQLTIYGWHYIGVRDFAPIEVGVENIAVRNGTVACASIRTHVTSEYQRKLFTRLAEAWQSISAGKIAPPEYAPARCLKFGSLCEVSDNCSAYQTYQNMPPEIKALKGLK